MGSLISADTTYLTMEAYLSRDTETDTRHELVDGTLIEMPPESDENLSIAKALFLELIKHVPADHVVWGTELVGQSETRPIVTTAWVRDGHEVSRRISVTLTQLMLTAVLMIALTPHRVCRLAATG
ncbi:hypothetical protein XM38_044270 [Halomicronema hongdechloris C2206]|uniref:Uncharacterized protein n=1 Tax=Halomicronema hongdechloris C2206 TaxID=1641165 RepID=A0A1Z3HT15_9CYAN|nr:Uma2 family endonuclease [Halomicronema hongdechloris]ASC73460.1 hypothetical protein XM38_044270 [Halomicronema hongdechloris C2206]